MNSMPIMPSNNSTSVVLMYTLMVCILKTFFFFIFLLYIHGIGRLCPFLLQTGPTSPKFATKIYHKERFCTRVFEKKLIFAVL
jgi:hypothetical protein